MWFTAALKEALPFYYVSMQKSASDAFFVIQRGCLESAYIRIFKISLYFCDSSLFYFWEISKLYSKIPLNKRLLNVVKLHKTE